MNKNKLLEFLEYCYYFVYTVTILIFSLLMTNIDGSLKTRNISLPSLDYTFMLMIVALIE